MTLHINHQWLPTAPNKKQLDIFLHTKEHTTTYEVVSKRTHPLSDQGSGSKEPFTGNYKGESSLLKHHTNPNRGTIEQVT